jgi:hypothetical protein
VSEAPKEAKKNSRVESLVRESIPPCPVEAIEEEFH